MIGVVRTSAHFRSHLGYCLSDKLTPAREDGERRIAYEHRAEIIRYNCCYGNRQELVRQFREVMNLNLNVCKPYLHVVLGLPPEDHLRKSQWADVSAECAKALDFDRRQYIAILHRDTSHQHVHLLVNRIGFEGGVVEDHFMLPRISKLCRRIEGEYQLTQIAGPRRYQTEEQRQVQRQDQRVLHLKQSIAGALETACNYPDFEERMLRQGYKIYQNERGIAFYREKLITHRGSEAGYSWKTIEGTLEQNERARLEREQKQVEEPRQLQQKQRLADELKQVPRHVLRPRIDLY